MHYISISISYIKIYQTIERQAGRQAGKDHIFTKVKERDQQDEIDAWLLAAATTTT